MIHEHLNSLDNDTIVDNLDTENLEADADLTEDKEGLSRWAKISIGVGSAIISAGFIANWIGAMIISQGAAISDKPVIYLYPTKTTKVQVSLGNFKKLLHTYPKYVSENGWNVMAHPNGDLIDLKTDKKYYALYWEGINESSLNLSEGFVIKGSETIEFLEDVLAKLGLNWRESNEFVMYWLPRLEKNKYNFIRFRSLEEINQEMPLDVSPKPDTVIRVFMEFKALDTYIDVPEQQLNSPERKGFTVVEWGGSEY